MWYCVVVKLDFIIILFITIYHFSRIVCRRGMYKVIYIVYRFQEGIDSFLTAVIWNLEFIVGIYILCTMLYNMGSYLENSKKTL